MNDAFSRSRVTPDAGHPAEYLTNNELPQRRELRDIGARKTSAKAARKWVDTPCLQGPLPYSPSWQS